MKHFYRWMLFAVWLLFVSCAPLAALATATPVATPSFTPTSTMAATATPTATASPSPTPTLTPTPDPYAGLTIADLSARSYGGGELQVVQALGENGSFTRSLVTFPSDGLTIYGFMNVPQGPGPFPVVVVVHGYVNPVGYQTLTYTTRYADALARAGYLVIHPNLRGYPPSDDGDNRFRVGFAVDVLNLLAVVRRQGGQPGPLEKADPQRIGLWGHSMGGGITIRTITIDAGVRAAVLYGAMSGDERLNFERIYTVFSNGARGGEELNTPAEDFARISPIFFLDRVQAAVSIHHGEADTEVPPEWSLDLCGRLRELNKAVECFSYPGQPHTFNGDSDQVFIQRSIDFYNRYLRGE